jgi:putative transport protein
VDYRRVLLSNAELAGRTVAELDLPGRFGGVVTRVRRGDLDLLARDDLHVLLGDRLRVVVPRGRMPEGTRYLGDTERRVSEVDAVSLSLGLTLGFLTGASLTLRQVGVLLFLAAVGLSSGPALADALGEPVGRKLLLVGAGRCCRWSARPCWRCWPTGWG